MDLTGLNIDIVTHADKPKPRYAQVFCQTGFTVSEMKNALEVLESAGLGGKMIADCEDNNVEVIELTTVDRHEMIRVRR